MESWRNDLFDRFYLSWRGIDAAYDKIAAGCGVTSNVMNIMTLLYKRRMPMVQNELCKDLHLSKQTVTSVLDGLEKRGWITRSIAEGDRRSRMVALTEEGRASGRHIGRAMRSVELAAFAALTDEEQHALVDSMDKLWSSLADVLREE